MPEAHLGSGNLVSDGLAALDEALAALPDLIRVAAYVSRGRGFADTEPYPDELARKALGALDDDTIRAALKEVTP